jgi:hypothetical protein
LPQSWLWSWDWESQYPVLLKIGCKAAGWHAAAVPTPQVS